MLQVHEDHPLYGSVQSMLARPVTSEVRDAASAALVFRPLLFPADGSGAEVEHFAACALDNGNYVIDVAILTRGTAMFTIVDPAQVFRWALTRSRPAVGVVVAHNHPSGNATPSRADREVTEALIAAGRTLHLPLLDHLVLADRGFTSIREGGELRFANLPYPLTTTWL